MRVMDDPEEHIDLDVDLTRVDRLSRIERKAIHAVNIQDWGYAETLYDNMLRLTDGWLAAGDPNVLLIQTHLTETLINQGKVDQANEIHQNLLDRIEPDTDAEKAILNQVLHLQIDIVNKLLRDRSQDALAILQNALEASVAALGRKHETTVSIRDSHSRVLNWDRAKIEKRMNRLKAKAEGQHGKRDKTTPVTAVAESPTNTHRMSPEIRLTSSTAKILDNEAVGLGISIVDDTSEYRTRRLFRNSHR